MNHVLRIAVASSLSLGLGVLGCASKNTADDEGLSSGETTLVADSDETDDVEETTEVGIEEPTSGAEPSDASGGLDPSTPDADREALLKKNPGLFFQPAGCIVTTVTRAGTSLVATHTFTNCTGPAGLRSFNGVITATWTFDSGKITVKREAKDFHVDGATLSGTQTVSWSRSGTVITKTRQGDWAGKTAAGKDITHTADYTVTYDAAAKCVTRDGSSSTTIGGRSFDRSITGYKRCGIGELGCPSSGKIVLTRTKGGDAATLTLEFLGGRKLRITRPSGVTVTRSMICRAAG